MEKEISLNIEKIEKSSEAITKNVNELKNMHDLLKIGIEEDKALIRKNMLSEKPSHFTDEQWAYYKSVGERLLKL